MDHRLEGLTVPKIRGIKPDYWTDEDIVELSIPARLLFIGLWNFACDNGHLDDKPKQIKMRIFPGDTVNIEALLEELVEHHRIVRENGTITILKFAHHQKPHSRWWTVCDLPECTKPDPSTTVAHPSSKGPNNGGPTGDHGRPRRTTAVLDGDVDGDVEVDGDLSDDGKPSKKKPARRIPKDWKPTPEHLQRCLAANIVIGKEAEKFRLHAHTNDRRAVSWNAAFTTWLIKAEEFAEKDRKATPKPRAPLPTEHEQPPDGLTPDEYAQWDYEQRQKRKGA